MKPHIWVAGVWLIVMSELHPVSSQEIFPSHKDLSVTITPKLARRSSGQFDYLYTILNDKNSNQTIYMIVFQNKTSLLESGTVEPGNRIKKPASWPRKSATPYDLFFWRPAIMGSNRGIETPVNTPPFDSVDPGELSEEFGVVDQEGPPTIIEWRVVGWAPIPILEESEEEDAVIIVPEFDYRRGIQVSEKRYKVDDVADTIWNAPETLPNSNPRANAVIGKTVGPSEPPTGHDVLCDTFILGLISQVREAAALGWIKHDLRKDDDKDGKNKDNDKGVKKGDDADGDDHADDDDEMDEKDKDLPGVAKSIIKKLTKVRRGCMRGKASTSREKLRALIKQVNTQRGKHLTEEAYALIKFNAEFLLEKL